MNKQHAMERLSAALTARLLATCPVAEVGAINRLHDACVDAGMHHAEPNETAWASARVANWLLAA